MKNAIKAMATAAVFVFSFTAYGETWYYNVINGTEAELRRGSSGPAVAPEPTGALTVPSKISAYPVTSLGDYSFYNCWDMTSATLPDSVRNIGQGSFYECRALAMIDGIDNVTNIGDYAFYNCTSLKSIELGNKLKTIGQQAFRNCTGLTSVVVPDSVTNIGAHAFYGCTNLVSLSLPDRFDGYLPEGIITKCSPDIKVFYRQRELGGRTWFYTVDGAGNATIEGITAGRGVVPAPIGTFRLPNVIGPGSHDVCAVGDYAFYSCSSITSVHIPDSITRIGTFAFSGCTALKTMTGGNKVREASLGAFLNCTGLEEFPFFPWNDSLLVVGAGAFAACTNLTQIPLLETVEQLGNGAFSYCTGLKKAEIPGRFKGDIAASAFANCSSDLVITYFGPEFTVENGRLTAVVLNGATSVKIPYWVTDIHQYAFPNDDGLTDVTIPANVTNINLRAFDNSRNISSFIVDGDNQKYKSVNSLILTKNGKTLVRGVNGAVAIPNTVTRISPRAFFGCSSLLSVSIPASVTGIGDNAFSGCSGLTSVTIPESVTSIGESSFLRCSGLTSVTIPDSVTSIGKYAFYQCTELKTASLPVRFKNNLASSVFKGCPASLVITYGDVAPTLTIGGGKEAMSRAYSCEAKTGESFSVACNSDWTATASDTWITITSGASGSGNGTIKYKLAQNADAQRVGKISVKCGTITRVCTITQDKPLLIGGKTEMARTYEKAAQTDCYFSVTCSKSPWTAASSASWITLRSDSKSGTGAGKIYYNVAANSGAQRTAKITVTSRGLSRVCTITQKAGAAATLTIGGGKESMSRGYSCEAKTGESFSVACNSSWTATPSASWITITSGASGSGNGTIKYTLAENTGASMRSGTIKVKCGTITRTCTITQDKPLLIGGKTSMSRTYGSAKQTGCYFTVTCSQTSWTAVSSASWVTLKTASGTGTAQLTYDVAANTSTSARTATIKVTSRGLTRTCTIKQNGK